MEWERIIDNHGSYLYRTSILGGWLVKVVDDVFLNGVLTQYEFRSSITFVPDINHDWKI